MKKILYIKSGTSAFYSNDQAILEEKYSVVPYLLPRNFKGWQYVFHLISLAGFLIRNRKDTVAFVTWFADYHAAVMVSIARLLGKKSIIFAGGQEAICYPELKKGVYFNKFRGICVKYALKNCSWIIPNHESLIWHENYYYSNEGKKDGIRYYIPGIRTPMTIIPNGVNTKKLFRDPSIPKENDRILTMGTIAGEGDFINKGFDLFLELARRMSDKKFTLIGLTREFLPWVETRYAISEIPNLEIVLFWASDNDLFLNFNRAWVFIQASITEGMPYTLNEAMLCECVPVGSNVNGIPDAIGDTGVIVTRRDINELETAVKLALSMNTGQKAKERVEEKYSMSKHREQLLDLLKQVLA